MTSDELMANGINAQMFCGSTEKTSQKALQSHILIMDIETTGLNSWYGDKVTCICAKTLDNSLTFRECSESEAKLLMNFN